MTSEKSTAAGSSEQDQYNYWRSKYLWLPRIAMAVGQWGIGRRLLLPGHYEVRRSRSFNRTIFRHVKR